MALKTLFEKCAIGSDLLTIEATVDSGFESMAADECKDKFGENVDIMKERGRIVFIIDKKHFPAVLEMRSIDNVYLVIGCLPQLELQKQKDEDLNLVKTQVNTPDWERWLPIWCEIMKFEGIVKPTPEQYESASARVRQEKEIEKARQAERQARHKERQQNQAKFRVAREERKMAARLKREADNAGGDIAASTTSCDDGNNIADSKKQVNESGDDTTENQCSPNKASSGESASQTAADKETSNEAVEQPEERPEGTDNDVKDKNAQEDEYEATAELDSAEVESLHDDDEKIEVEESDIPPNERVLRFRATCYRTGKHEFTSMQAACEFGGELQQKFSWVVDLTKFHLEVVLSIDNDEGHVSLALTKESLHRRNIKFFGPTSLRATICHNLLRLADLQPGDVVLDPLAGGGSIPIEGAVAFKNIFNLGGEIYPAGVNRMYSNVRVLRSEGHSLALDMTRWDARKLPLREASVDVVVSDMPFGVRMSSRTNNRSLYKNVLREMARVVRPNVGRAIILTLDRRNFNLALASTMGLWWQSRVLSANIGGLDAAVFTLKRTEKLRPTEEDLAEDNNWRNEPRTDFDRRSYGRGGGHGRGGGYARGGGYNRGRGGRRGGYGGRGGYQNRHDSRR